MSVLVSSQSNGSCTWGFISCRGKGCIVHKLKIIVKEKKNIYNQRLNFAKCVQKAEIIKKYIFAERISAYIHAF